MSLYGFTDSLANFGRETKTCPRCGGVSRLASGLCLTCLMQAGLDPAERNQKESFESMLDKIDISDSDWRIGHYEILEEVGRGGMGVIYRARQKFSERIVALKRVLNYHADSPETLARFRREAEAASSLDHPNILPIYEVGESEDGLPFFAMKFAPGGSLREVGPALKHAPDRIVPLMLRVTRALHSAHTQGLLHRDLKPGNILLDGRGEPLVTDFGLAKWLDPSNDLTRTLTIFGTPGYIAPEQARGSAGRLGPTADVYSLGAILFDLLAGRPPFLGEHALAVISQAVEKDAPRLRSLVRSIDRDLETICARCLERDPSARYSSAGELADDLERWLENKPIVARPVLAPARMWRWARRNPALATICTAFLVLAALSWPKFVENRRYQTSLRNAAAWQHSVTVLPFLDLDNASADDRIASDIARVLDSHLSTIGPCRVIQTQSPDLIFAPAPRTDEIATAARRARVRTVLAGTKRLVNGKTFLSMRLVDPAQANLIPPKSIMLMELDRTESGSFFQSSDAELYKFIGTSFAQTSKPKGDEKSLDFIDAGRALMDRRTVSDIDRAIRLF
jgi:serine/threonine protein kinase